MIDMDADLELLASEGIRRMSRAEYDDLIERGWFVDEPIELIHGVLVKMSPIGDKHALTRDALTELLVLALAGRARVRAANPLPADDWSEPEPDFSVVQRRRYTKHPGPEHTLFVVEVANSSLRKDRRIKGPLYASAGVQEYWIVNLQQDCIEVYTNPAGAEYTTVRTFERGESVSPQSFPDVSFAVSDIIQPAE
jgi:Uma2 family endonuclease